MPHVIRIRSTSRIGKATAGAARCVPLNQSRSARITSVMANALLTFDITLVILALLLWITGTHLGAPAVAFPVLLIDLVLITCGIALFLAPLHVRYHDVGYLWGIAVQVGFWLTPIIYQEVMIPEHWRWLMTYNPLARIILYSRQALIYGVWPDLVGVLKTSLVAVLVLVGGWAMFQSQQARLVEHY